MKHKRTFLRVLMLLLPYNVNIQWWLSVTNIMHNISLCPSQNNMRLSKWLQYVRIWINDSLKQDTLVSHGTVQKKLQYNLKFRSVNCRNHISSRKGKRNNAQHGGVIRKMAHTSEKVWKMSQNLQLKKSLSRGNQTPNKWSLPNQVISP